MREVAAAADPVTRTFVVKADIGRADVRLGQTANVKIEMPRVAGQIKLPLAAVFEAKGDAGRVGGRSSTSMTVKPQPVRVAGAEGNDVVLAGGVAPGETVVVAGVHVLSAGQKVRLYAERTAAALPAPRTAAAWPLADRSAHVRHRRRRRDRRRASTSRAGRWSIRR